MDSIGEVNTEDFGFSLATDEKGFSVFDSAIDFDVHEEPLNLLSIGNKTGIIAISNVDSLCLDTLDAVDKLIEQSHNSEADVSKESLLRSVAGDDLEIKQVFLSPDEQTLFIVNNNKLQKLSTKSFIAGEVSRLTDCDIGVAIIKSVIPSPIHNERFLVLDDSNTLFLWENSSLDTISSNVASACWSKDGTSYSHILNNTTTIKNSANATHIPIDVSQDDEFESDKYHIKHIFDIKSKFIAVFESNDSELDYHTTKTYYVEKIGSGYVTQKLELEPPSNTVSRHLTYYMTWISEWKENETLFFFSSGSSTDVDSLVSDASGIRILQLEDTNRAQFPIDDEADVDTSPVGMAVDLRAFEAVVKEPCSGVEEVKGKLPKVYTLLHTGKLIAWWVFDKYGILDETVDLRRAYSVSPAVEKDDPTSISVIKEIPSSQSDDSTTKGVFEGSSGFESGSTKFGGSTGAFGSLLTSDKIRSKSPEEKPVSFGSVAFGSTGQSSQSAAFGTSPQASKPVAVGIGASPAFGSIGFGAPSFGTTSFGNAHANAVPATTSKSTFSNYANSPSRFGSSSTAKASPFERLTSGSGSSPFASVGSGDNKSPFGELQESKSIFGQESTIEDKTEPSIFGSTTQVVSPFAKLGNLDIRKDGSNKRKESPFGLLGQDTDPKESPFASITQHIKFESPFSKLGSVKLGEKQLTGSGASSKTDNSNEQASDSLGKSESLKKRPVFGGLGVSSPNAFDEIVSDSDSSLTATQQVMQDYSDSDETHESEDQGYELTQEENMRTANVRDEEVRENSYTVASGRGNYVNDSTTYDEQIPDRLIFNKEANRLNEFMLSKDTRENIAEDSSESFEEVGEHHLEEFLSDESYEHLEEEEEEEEEDEIEKLLANKPSANPELLKFDGFQGSLQATSSPIEDMMSTIYQNTTGQLKILETNTDKIIAFIGEHDYETSYSNAALKYPDFWHLASSHNIGILAEEENQDITAIIEQAVSQESKSKELEDEVKLLQQKRIYLDKLVSQLSTISISGTDSLLKSRPLDFANEALQISIRKKLARVKRLEEILITKMMPLKARCSVDEGIAQNLEKVTRKLHSSVADHRIRIDMLTKEVDELSVNEKKEIPRIEAYYTAESIKPFAKTRLSNRLRNCSEITKVKF